MPNSKSKTLSIYPTPKEEAAAKVAEALSGKIGIYELEELAEEEKKIPEKVAAKATEKNNAAMAAGYLANNKKVKAALVEGCVEETNIATNVRKEFVKKLLEVLADDKKNLHRPTGKTAGSNPTQYATTMEQLLGKDLLELYHRAIAEERTDPNFRKAVFAKAFKHYKDVPATKERLILWVAGPSASGKTYAAGQVLRKACGVLNANSTELTAAREGHGKGHNALFVDGGIEREESQIRQLMLQVALAKGYPGIKDLHQHTKLNIKKYVKKAALQTRDVSLVIPNTFSNPLTKFKIRKYASLPGTKQIFSQIVGKEKEVFRKTVARMGISRAYKSDFFKPNADMSSIKINNRDIGVESKVYQRKYFKAGVKGSRRAKQFYLRSAKDPLYLEFVNDKTHVYFNAENNKWQSCEDGKSYDVGTAIKMVSTDEFNKWDAKQYAQKQSVESFEKWLEDERKANNSAPVVKVFKNGQEVSNDKKETLKAKAAAPIVAPKPALVPSSYETGGKVTPVPNTAYNRPTIEKSIDAVKKVIASNYKGWKMDEVLSPDGSQITSLSVRDNKTERFTIHPAEIKTNEDNIETFKAMLECFKAANPDKLPAVTAYSEKGKQLWEQAVNEIYKEEINDKKKIEIVMWSPVAPTNPAPAPEAPKI